MSMKNTIKFMVRKKIIKIQLDKKLGMIYDFKIFLVKGIYMSIIKNDIHGYYIKNNGSFWRPIWPDDEIDIAAARKMEPKCHKNNLVGLNVRVRLNDTYISVTIFGQEELWYNHGRVLTGKKSTAAYRDFQLEREFIKNLVASGLSIREAYQKLWNNISNS